MSIQTVMIVDDDEDDRLLFGEALLIANPESELMIAKNGEHALKILRQKGILLPDFIFLDLNMPKMNGWQCLRQLREIESLKTIPVIIFSTSKEDKHSNEALLLESVFFFTKPPKFSVLVAGLERILKKEWIAINEMNKAAYG